VIDDILDPLESQFLERLARLRADAFKGAGLDEQRIEHLGPHRTSIDRARRKPSTPSRVGKTERNQLPSEP